MKQIFFISVILMVFSGAMPVCAENVVLIPTDDTFLQRLKTIPETGSATNLPVRRGIDEPLYNRYAIFKFDVSSYTGNITGDVLFRLYFKEERSGSSLVYNDIQRQLIVAELPEWTWTEATLTPYSVPNPATAQNSQFSGYVALTEGARVDISSTKRSTFTTGVYWEWDLTDFVKAKKAAGQMTFSIIVYESATSGGQGSSDMYFLSKESATNKPQLVISEASSNANLSSISIDKEGDGNFQPFSDYNDQHSEYICYLPLQAVNVPVLTATPSRSGASVTITQAQSIDGELAERTAIIEVTALDNVTKKTYTVVFEKKDENTGSTTVELNLWSSASNRYTRNAQLVSRMSGFQSDPDATDDFNWYGSNFNIRTDSTGFFYVKKIDGRWWLVDPDGYAGLNMAVTTINTAANVADWAYDLMKGLGYNGAGNFITPENLPVTQYNNKSFEPFSYTRRGLGDRGNVGPSSSGGFFQRYRAYRLTKGYTFPSNLDNGNYITIMDPEFEEFCDTHAKNYFAPSANERNLMGVFSDNEINFNQDQIQNFLKDLPETDPNYISALNFITSKGISKATVISNYGSVPNAVKEEYAGILAEWYFSKVSAALKKHMPNHLYLGSRLHGRPRGIRQVVEASARWCDVISVNFYNYPTPNEEITHPKKWTEWTHDKPCLITEFYVKGLEPSNIDLQDGAGYMVRTQNDRGVFYQNTCLEVLQSGYFIGWQYFRWIDDGTSNKGIVSVNNEPWTEMIAYMKELNNQVYRIVDFIDDRVYAPLTTKEIVLYPAGDTYISLPENSAVKGLETTLQIGNAAAATGESEAFLKFALGNYKDSLQYIENAVLRLYDASGNYTDRDLKIFGVANTDWDETTFNAAIAASIPEMRNSFGKLRAKKSRISAGKNYIDLNVRNWLIKGVDRPEYVTFRITDNSDATQPSAWYSKENGTLSPQLILNIRANQTSGTQLPGQPETKIYQQGDQICFSGFQEILQGSIYNISGVCVWKGEIAPSKRIDAGFPAGIYVVRLFDGLQNINRKIVIK
ncbi:MAG: DNRLRE domain-containing protein [Paludibacter sp.]|nr:DNRLRE domain-containing protein [Paludibacter sp.]